MSPALTEHTLPFFRGGGAMGALMREKDWSKTAVGPPEQWPAGLRTAITILLQSRFPMFIWWGADHIMFYNDAYLPIAGEKHPKALGGKGHEVWAEVWDSIGPLVSHVITEQASTWAEDQLLYINRHGYTEACYFTFSHSPLIDESGKAAGVFCVVTETTEKVLNSRRLAESENKFRNLVMQAPVGICIVSGRPLAAEVVNDHFIELVGKTRKDFQDKPYWEVIPEAAAFYAPILDQVFREATMYLGKEHEMLLVRNGEPETVFVDFVYEPIREAQGVIQRVMILAIEVTDKVLARKKIEDVVSVRTAALKQANDQLRKSNEELEQFAYIASHDMQEPLRKVSTFTELLEANLGTIDQKSEYYIDKIKSSSARMLNLIRDVLSYSQLDRQQRWEYVDLNTIVEGIRNDFELLIDQKQAVINAGPLPRVKAIPLQMSQLFSNLLSNALKFSKPGSAPVISITAREEEGSRLAAHALPNEDRTYYHIEVADNGIGFDPDKADQIFQIFQRLHGQTEYSGTGIGLALCRRIAQNHKGTIYATGEEGKGAVFHILLPA